MTDKALGSFEYAILLILMTQPQNAYGAMLQERLEASTGKEPSMGAIYTALDRLIAKGFVTSKWGEPTAERGGRRKRYYSIEGSGREAVRRTEEMFRPVPDRGFAMGVA